MIVVLPSGTKNFGSHEILWSVDRYAVVRDRDHPYGVAVFDEARNLHSLGAFQGACWSFRER
ncbi:hypothetical protein OG413_27855 [Streptomyces sp. NBC_01433]|uniref:hypothetical protein n=1 Tax=Streptomyces sp. NBC_01433 TaxID=2903864 RepID=UPI00225B1A84|nr:hypothetical protein [Streptomyces sp. NBC_01433]MCX4679074.1 hypothetical protein [Streptomyces sp. NBC_01433]